MNREKRIRDLEDKVLGKVEPGSSKLHLFQPVVSEAEEVFFQKVYNIMDTYKGTDTLPTPEEMELMKKGVKRLFIRAVDVFETVARYWLCIDDDELKRLWTIRFWYFMLEMMRHANQARKEREIADSTRTWKQYDKKWAKYFATLSDEEKLPLWSTESFFYFMHKYIFREAGDIDLKDLVDSARRADAIHQKRIDEIISKEKVTA